MPKQRAKHVKTEYEEARKKYRDSCPRHVVTFETDMTEDQKRHVFAYSERLRVMGNNAVGVLKRRLEQLIRTKEYRALMKDYGWHSEHMKGLDELSDRYKQLDDERKAIGEKMGVMQKKFRVTLKDVKELTEKKADDHDVGTIFALTRGEDIWNACKKILYGDGKHLHFRKRGDLPVIRAKQIERGITMRLVKGQIVFNMEDIGRFHIRRDPKDLFLEDEYTALCAYLADPSVEQSRVEQLDKSKCLIPVFRPCYASLVCREIRGKLRVYVQINIADNPLPKRRKDGSPRHDFSKTGRVGCDNGSQSFAVVSKDVVLLENTAERGGKSTKAREKLIRQRQRKMGSSRRKTNPERFNPDGTYKKGTRGKMKKSKHYRRLQRLVREQQRREADSRKYAIREDANRIRSLGDELVIEPSNAKALQRRSKKPAEKSDKTIEIKQKDGTTKTVQKNKRKKRFGRSVLHRCPGTFQADLKKKFGDGYHEVSKNFRASQYDHVIDKYIKKKLEERWHVFQDGKKVQRDIYSAFLMFCSDNDYKTPDRAACLAAFDQFFKLHEALIESIIRNHLNICNSGISA